MSWVNPLSSVDLSWRLIMVLLLRLESKTNTPSRIFLFFIISHSRSLCRFCFSLFTPSFLSKDASAFMCGICRQTFMSNARPPLLYQHVVAKHPAGTDPLTCFPTQLAGFDPNDPNGEKKPATSDGPPKPKKVVAKKVDPLDALLDAGLKKK